MFNYYLSEPSYENIIACIRSYQLKEVPHIRKLYDYYNSKHAIMKREAPEGRPCNKVVTNFCRAMVDDTAGFVDMADASSVYDLGEIESIFKDTLITGIGYGLLEWDNSERVLRRIAATKALVIKDLTLAHNPIAGVVLNPYVTYEGGLKKEYIQFFIYDDTFVYEYVGTSLETAELISKKAHNQGVIPLFEARSSVKYEGLFDHVITLQDAYNYIDSTYSDSRETFAESFLLVKGMSLLDDAAESLINAESKIINLPVPGADASYLTKSDSATDVISYLNSIKERIHSIANIPDFNQEGNYGVASGASNEFRAIAFLNLVNSRKNIFYNTFLQFIDPSFSYKEEESISDTSDSIVD